MKTYNTFSNIRMVIKVEDNQLMSKYENVNINVPTGDYNIAKLHTYVQKLIATFFCVIV